MKYKVCEGDTLAKVSKKFGVRVFDLLLHNQTLQDQSTYIQPGMLLSIPKVASSPNLMNEMETEYGPIDLIKDAEKLSALGVDVTSCGQSVMGKDILLFKMGSGKKQIFYSGGWHANEWHTSKFLIQFLFACKKAVDGKKHLYNYDVRALLKEVTLFVVPMVNPDGILLSQQGIYPEHPYYEEVLKINKGKKRFDHWSSNIRGVDLNHQWPAGWEKEAKESPQIPWPRHFSGVAPLTEPEAQAIHRLTLNHQFAYVLAFHSQGQVIYWGYRQLEPIASKEMVRKLSLVSSYTPIQTADSDAGYKDWFIQETGRPGFTIEVGVGVNPLSNDAYSEIWSNVILLALEGLQL